MHRHLLGLNLDAMAPGPGAVDLQLSVAIIERIDSSCIPALSDGGVPACVLYGACAQATVAATEPNMTPAACSTTAGSDAGATDGG